MKAREYLKRIQKIDVIIQNKLAEHRRWVEIATGLGEQSTSDRVQSSRNLQRIPEAIGNYIDIEKDIAELVRERKAILQTIEQLPAFEYDLLHKLFVQRLTLYDVAAAYSKSYSWATTMQGLALQRLQAILDEQTKPQ